MNFKSSTPKGTEGFNISYSDELRCAEALNKVLPEGWTILFSWAQILFSDVQYKIDKKNKVIDVVYNQNLHIWWKDVVREIEGKLKEKAPTPVNA
jgi:hypothetical protein